MEHSSLARRVAGLVLDAPALDWKAILSFNATEMGLPSFAADPLEWMVVARIDADWGSRDALDHTDDFHLPILLFLGTEDKLVPSRPATGSPRTCAAGSPTTACPAPATPKPGTSTPGGTNSGSRVFWLASAHDGRHSRRRRDSVRNDKGSAVRCGVSFSRNSLPGEDCGPHVVDPRLQRLERTTLIVARDLAAARGRGKHRFVGLQQRSQHG